MIFRPFVSLLLFGFTGFSLAAQADRTISVYGECMKRVSPDRGSVTLVAQFTERDAAEASRKSTETYEKIRKAVQKLNLKDVEVQTSEYNIREDFDFSGNKRTSRGFQASIGLQVITSEIPRLGEVTALGNQFQVQRAGDLSTYLSAEKNKSTHESCLVEAIKNARDKAEKMAASAQARVGEVQLIDENPVPETSPRPITTISMASLSMADKAGPVVESRSETVSVRVLVKFALR